MWFLLGMGFVLFIEGEICVSLLLSLVYTLEKYLHRFMWKRAKAAKNGYGFW